MAMSLLAVTYMSEVSKHKYVFCHIQGGEGDTLYQCPDYFNNKWLTIEKKTPEVM